MSTQKRPRILLVDIPDECKNLLQDAGYSVAGGTFGYPYDTEPGPGLLRVNFDSVSLPEYSEQDIVVANLARTPRRARHPDKAAPIGVGALWQSTARGVIDPRPVVIRRSSESSVQILAHGGIFILLTAAPYSINYTIGEPRPSGTLQETGQAQASNWDLIPDLTALLGVQSASGREITFETSAFAQLLSRGAEGATYDCVFSFPAFRGEEGLTLARNKYGQMVAGAMFYGKSKGLVVLLPQLPHLATILRPLLEQICATINPNLFPHLDKRAWTSSSPYELPRILQLRNRIDAIRKAAAEQVVELEKEIEVLQKDHQHWYVLQTGTGRELVEAVILALRRFGFEKVIDMDAVATSTGNAPFREDIQVLDLSPALIVDVKGVNGYAEDEETQQAEKHLLMRSREWGRTDLQALTIINTQRQLPPLEREISGFRQELIDNAVQMQSGLMTTWDLVCLLRGMEEIGWRSEDVKPLFYGVGRIWPVPAHYKPLGPVVKRWKNAFGVIPLLPVAVGARLAVRMSKGFDLFGEFCVTSIKVDNQATNLAPAGSNCGIELAGDTPNVREGNQVYLVSRAHPEEAPSAG